MSDGRYTLHFAANKTIRLYHFNDDNIRFTINPTSSVTQNKIIRTLSPQIQIKPKTVEFQDCISHQLRKNCSYPIPCQTENELLEDNIQCEVLNTSSVATQLSDSFALEAVSAKLSQCEWMWIPENQAFVITLNKTYIISNEIADVFSEHLDENDLIGALTCKVSLAYHSNQVKFGIPFILTSEFPPISGRPSGASFVAVYFPLIIVTASMVTGLLIMVFWILCFCCYARGHINQLV